MSKGQKTLRQLAAEEGHNIDDAMNAAEQQQHQALELAAWFTTVVFPAYMEKISDKQDVEEYTNALHMAHSMIDALKHLHMVIGHMASLTKSVIDIEDARVAEAADES